GLSASDEPERHVSPRHGQRHYQEQCAVSVSPHDTVMGLAESSVDTEDLTQRDACQNLDGQPKNSPSDAGLRPGYLEPIAKGKNNRRARYQGTQRHKAKCKPQPDRLDPLEFFQLALMIERGQPIQHIGLQAKI